MKTKLAASGLSDSIVGKLCRAFDNCQNLDTVILYGSRALGTYKTGSDIDLTFIGKQLSFSDVLKLEAELDDLLTPYSFDLSVFHELDNPKLIEHINRVGVVFYERGAKLEISDARKLEASKFKARNPYLKLVARSSKLIAHG